MMLRTPPPRQRSSTPNDSQSPERRGSYSLQRRLWEQSNMSTPYHHTINVPSPPKRSRLFSDEDIGLSPVLATPPMSGKQVVTYSSTVQTVETGLEEQAELQPLHWDDGMRCSYKCTNMVKSELLEALDTTSKHVLELESASKSYKSRLHDAESERKGFKQKIASLEQALAAADAREKSLQSQRLAEADKAVETYRQQLMRCSELQGRLQEEMKLKADAEITATAATARAVDAEAAKSKLEQAAEREQTRLKEQLKRVKQDDESTILRLKAENQLEKGRVQSAIAERKLLEGRVEELQTRLAENLDEKREIEHMLLTATAQASTTRTTSASEAESVIKHLREELTQNSADVLKAKRLQQEHIHIELLKEKLESERERANRAELALCQIVDRELQIAALEAELHAWKETIDQIPGVSALEDLLPKFAQLQKAILTETARTGEVSAQLVELRIALETAEAAKLEAHVKADSALQEVANVNLNLKRMERKMMLLGKERDGLKAILASYDEEEAVIVSHQKPGSGIADLTTPENVKQQRIKELEVALEGAKRHSESLEESLDATSKELKAALVKAEVLSKGLKDAEGRIKNLEGKEDVLRSELALAESKIGRGDFNPATTKVVHMIDNLKLGADENQLKLQAEIAILKKKLGVLEKGSCSLEQSSVAKGAQSQEDEVVRLTQRVASLEKREARYRQVFADKIAAFREACYLLFGYTVKMTEQQDMSGLTVTLLNLHSKYAQRDEEQLEFQYTPGDVNMIENEYSSSPELAPLVNTFLRKWNCIPAFIANLTMESFSKVTMG